MTIVVPSNWLKKIVEKSFLSEYDIKVEYNEVNTEVFKPTPSLFKREHGIADKKMILGVASAWNERKGLYDLVSLSKMIDSSMAKVVIVGLSKGKVKRIKLEAPNIIAIEKTDNLVELAEIYTAADIFVNPSYEETFGLTTAEAILCGTKAIVYKGSASEEIAIKYGGQIVESNIKDLYNAIMDELMV